MDRSNGLGPGRTDSVPPALRNGRKEARVKGGGPGRDRPILQGSEGGPAMQPGARRRASSLRPRGFARAAAQLRAVSMAPWMGSPVNERRPKPRPGTKNADADWFWLLLAGGLRGATRKATR